MKFPTPPPPSDKSTAGGSSGSNRRTGGRLFCSGIKTQYGDVADLSHSGVRLTTRSRPPCELGDVVTLNFAGEVEPVQLPARLARIRTSSDGAFDLGFRFWNLNENQRRLLAEMARSARQREDHGFRLAS